MTGRRDVRYGRRAILAVPGVVTELGARRVLLVCGRRSFEASGAARMLPDLERVARVRRFSEFTPNADVADLTHGLRTAAEFDPDLVLGVGGGSALDMAKLLCAYQGTTDQTELAGQIRAGRQIAARRARLVLAPTTSGSGSEATHFAVVYVAGEKFSVAGPVLRPDVAVLDPDLPPSGSAYQRATSGIDAVAQAIESMWAVAATEQSRRWARWALALLLPCIERFVHQPDDRSGRAMAIGSHLAGRAIDSSKTTAAHALSYGFTTRYGISHGHAVALTLGGFLAVHTDLRLGRLRSGVDRDTHAETMRELFGRLGAGDPLAAGAGDRLRERFVSLLERLGLAPTLSRLGHVPNDLRALAEGVNLERLSNNPVALDVDELTKIISWSS